MNNLFMTWRDDSDQNGNILTLSVKLTNRGIIKMAYI